MILGRGGLDRLQHERCDVRHPYASLYVTRDVECWLWNDVIIPEFESGSEMYPPSYIKVEIRDVLCYVCCYGTLVKPSESEIKVLID